MRVGDNTGKDLITLNCNVSSNDEVGDFAVTLTAYVKVADGINEKKLEEIEAEEFYYQGEVEGDFRMHDAPVPMELRLKVGAQVIFCRNDFAHGLVNGTIAKVIELDEDLIKVVLEDGKEIAVEKMVWEKRESVYNKETKKVESVVTGSFTQYPLKLAWAITIHKSQGMSFDRMHFDLTRGTFAPGQAYVAISRMRSMDGLTLSNEIRRDHIKPNLEIKAFANSFNDVKMIDEELAIGRESYKYLAKKDYENAAKVCLIHSLEKMKSGDYRNAALLAKKMFDVMLDDKCLMGLTNDVPLLKDCSTTCHFLNAVVCLYAGRLDEAIGYADLVLDRRPCLEAMFVKGKALQGLNRYGEAWDVSQQIRTAGEQSDDKISIDKKQHLFEAELNAQLGKPNTDNYKQLLRLCPEYIPVYLMLRKEVLDKLASEEDDEDENTLFKAYKDKSVTDDDFKALLEETDKSCATFKLFLTQVRKIFSGDC